MNLVQRLTKKWPEHLPDTGFKVGVATSTVLVKRIGRHRHRTRLSCGPVRPSTTRSKQRQSGDAHELIVTGSVWDAIAEKTTSRLRATAKHPRRDCGATMTSRNVHDDEERSGRCLISQWCATCGEGFCNAILERPGWESGFAQGL